MQISRGVECMKGWKGLYDPLIELCKLKEIEVTQVKEKFGTLRFYIGDSDGSLDLIIRAAERMSSFVCEECGCSGLEDVQTSGPGWIKTLCKKCRAARAAQHAAQEERLVKKYGLPQGEGESK